MKRTALFLLAFVLLVACRPISRGPSPYQPPSPLAILSPLYARGALPTLPDGLIAPLDEQRSGTIPTILPAQRYRLFAPIMAHQKRYPCGAVPVAAELLRLMIEDTEQMRRNPRCDNAMVAIAQNRANDMTRRRYYSHFTPPENWGPNKFLAIAGCLPDGYPENGNSVESITLNYRTPLSAWDALKRSPGHRPHVLGTHPFWQAQVAIGVGWSGNEWGEVFVVMSTEGCK